jgi:DNA polymerase-3 subunit gamma/tau
MAMTICFRIKNSMEQFIVSARKYRPQTFNDVVGQKPLPILAECHRKQSPCLCPIFTGPRGVGKRLVLVF